eukprot:CAMPEP_0172088180 /NCGR_PEP_ID=MMETSP1043-20130122/23100_1 /TAXON_ID=464988 /ORGANISM="Hemiselmis andersenii, Strain CCMP441" /LENGTH=129 /DNA_ID=CAMNT_0012750475 /DNA_START=280 /DNA_END=671 /DNA_ORIENTATION=+
MTSGGGGGEESGEKVVKREARVRGGGHFAQHAEGAEIKAVNLGLVEDVAPLPHGKDYVSVQRVASDAEKLSATDVSAFTVLAVERHALCSSIILSKSVQDAEGDNPIGEVGDTLSLTVFITRAASSPTW